MSMAYPFDPDYRDFPSEGVLQEQADKEIRELLEPLKPLTWEKVSQALKGRKWRAYPSFWAQNEEDQDSSEYGDYTITIPHCLIGYRTYRGGIEAREPRLNWEAA